MNVFWFFFGPILLYLIFLIFFFSQGVNHEKAQGHFLFSSPIM